MLLVSVHQGTAALVTATYADAKRFLVQRPRTGFRNCGFARLASISGNCLHNS